jgi:hypothetical protein
LTERLDNSAHRSSPEAPVSGENGESFDTGGHPGKESNGGPRISGIEDLFGLSKSEESVTLYRYFFFLGKDLHFCSQSSQALNGCQAILAEGESGDAGHPSTQGADYGCPVAE